MTHWLLNPTFSCNKDPFCRYCWLNSTIRQRTVAFDRPYADWMKLLGKMKPGDMVDIAGGEPLLLPWIPDYLLQMQRRNIRWALSTNIIDDEGLHKLLSQDELVGIVNVSWHGQLETDEFVRRVVMLDNKFYVTVNFLNVDLEPTLENTLRGAGIRVHESPYEEPLDLVTPSGVGYCCSGGTTHMVVDPHGDYWPCLTALRSPRYQEYKLGNIMDNVVYQSGSAVMNPCHLKCEQAGILKTHPGGDDIWHVGARVCAS